MFASAVMVGLLCLAQAAAANAERPATEFDAANRLYEQGKFREAATNYEKLVRNGQVSTAIYFNLGNAYFKNGELGRAIAAYREAERLSPRDPDLQANLQFARNQVQGATLPASAWQRWLRKLSVNEWTWAAASGFWICLLLLTARQFRPAWRSSLCGASIVAGVAFVLLGCCLGAAMQTELYSRITIVVSRDAPVRQGPLDEANIAFTVHDGSELQVLDRKDDWLQVRADPGHIGWVRRDQVLLAVGS